MGVYRTDYVMMGVKLPFDAIHRDNDIDLIEGQPGRPFDVVIDHMSGEYAVAGYILASSDYDEGTEFKEFDPSSVPGDLRAKIEARLGREVEPLRLMLFSHYS